MRNIKIGLIFGSISIVIGIIFSILYYVYNQNDVFLIIMVFTLVIWTVFAVIFGKRYDNIK